MNALAEARSRPASRGMLAAPEECVSVVVPCRNEAMWIGGLLDAIRTQEAAVLEIVLVDTGSDDGTQDVVERYQRAHPDLPLRCVSVPGAGIAEAMNRGVVAARGDIIVRLDGHSRPAADYVCRVLEALQETDAAVVGGVWMIAPGGQTVVADAIAYAVAHPVGAGDALYRTGRMIRGRQEVDTVPFGCFRKVTWEELGGYDEELLTNEDYEFNYRVRATGLVVLLDPDIRCTYFARSTLARLRNQYFRYGWWKVQMLKRHPRSLRWRQVVPGALVPLFVGLAASSLVWSIGAFLLGAFAFAYGSTLVIAATQVASRQRRWCLVWPLVASFAVVHGSWSTGFASNIVSFGRWPRRPRPAETVAPI